MAFKIEDLMFSIRTEGENEAVMRLEAGEELLMEVMFASCGMTQGPRCPGDPNLAGLAEGVHVAFRPRADNLAVLQEELEDALEAVKRVQAALAAPAQLDMEDVEDVDDDDEPLSPLPDTGEREEGAPLTMSDGD